MAGVRTPANPPNAHVNVDNEDDNGGPELGDPTHGALSIVKLALKPSMTHLISHYGYTYTDYHIEYSYPCNLASLASYINQPGLPLALCQFLYACQYPDQEILTIIDDCPLFNSEIQVYHSAVATFYAPSDLCGAGGMWHEWI